MNICKCMTHTRIFPKILLVYKIYKMHIGQWLYKAIADVGRDYYGAILWERNDQSALDETTGKIFRGERSSYRNI